ncbi:hypothetical protein AMTRI_Chr12g268020 [Amborella trichopoda]|uniref:Gnk2-homologous domain-containing protein n=1 Tax=Amborella trichopoda TaxID=13333 RepID=W1PEP4_AMBTC|nr:cysteine-rich repeat secretory protein 38 [Amborella trichopoda]ERN05535.1 hypothetical protein AMTR_s00007p00264250 [Amborella trichopoda]|eukprot:XP_006843860.1 cysteine-rich repeat secretory protein 38 [Amborella trichopoda]
MNPVPFSCLCFFLVFSCALLLTNPVNAFIFVDYYCLGDTNYTANSPFESNLYELFRSLPGNASLTGFYNDTKGTSPDQAYGLIQCRGDQESQECHDCAGVAGTDITGYCPNSKSAILWFDECLLHYSDSWFFSSIDINEVLLYNRQNVTNPDLFRDRVGQLMGNLSSTVVNDTSKFLYATREIGVNETESIYGLVQCTRNLNRDNCSNCLRMIISDLAVYGDSIGAQVHTGSCSARYEIYPFFNATVFPPPPPPALPPPPTSFPPPPESHSPLSQPPNTQPPNIVDNSSGFLLRFSATQFAIFLVIVMAC